MPQDNVGCMPDPNIPCASAQVPTEGEGGSACGVGTKQWGGLRTNLRGQGRQRQVDDSGTEAPGSGVYSIVPES